MQESTVVGPTFLILILEILIQILEVNLWDNKLIMECHNYADGEAAKAPLEVVGEQQVRRVLLEATRVALHSNAK